MRAKASHLGFRLAFYALAPICLVALLMALSTPSARADLFVDGDWTITGPEFYADLTITVNNTTQAEGNVTVAPGGNLVLQNVTLVLPFRSTLDVQGLLVAFNSTLRGETWNFWIRGDALLVGDTVINATDGGTVVESTNATLERVMWDCGGGSAGTIHIRRAIDFRNQTMRRCLLAYELPSLSVDKNIEIANNTFNDSGSGTQINFADSYHTGQVRFDVHDISFNGGGWGIYIGATAPATSYLIHEFAFANTSAAAIRADSFEGELRVWNATFSNVLRAARVNGVAGGTVVATLDNITVNGTTSSIYAEDATWIVRNSTIYGANPQFEAGPNGHIRIYDTADNAFASGVPAGGGSIEHFITLEMAAPTWQNAVPIVGNLVNLLDASGAVSLQVNASTWTPQEIVWWGMYPGGSTLDRRQLRPKIQDGATAFNCTPASFFVSPGMALVDVTCTDDAPPKLTALTPAFPRIQNTSTISGTARVDEPGSGLNTVEFSLDGSAYGPVTFAPGESRNFSFSRGGVADGTYSIWLRAVDRTGNARVVTVGPYTIDTTVPVLGIVAPPAFVSGATYLIEGSTEPNTTVTAARAGGYSNTTRSDPTGAFSLGVQLEEGQNTYTVTAFDAAGNMYSVVMTTKLDTQAPPLLVLLDGAPASAAFTRESSVRVEGSTEAGASVTVNGLAAARNAEQFTLELALARGLTNITVVATDLAGNEAVWFGVAYSDDAPPTLSITLDGAAPAGGSLMVTRSGAVAVAGSAHDVETGVVSLVVNSREYALDGAGEFSVALSLAEGPNSIVVTASDAVGNTVSVAVVVIRDSTAPAVTADIRPDAAAVVFLDGTAYTNGSTAKIVLVVTEEGTAQLGGVMHNLVAGENPFVVTLAEGRNSFAVTAQDLAGNAALPLSVVVIRDSLPPTIHLSAPVEGAVVETGVFEVVGSSEPLAVVRVNGQAVSVSPAGEFRVAVTVAEGLNTLTVEAADPLGNTNMTSRTLTGLGAPPSTIEGSGVSSFVLPLALGVALGAAVGLLAGRSRGRRAGEDVPEARDEPASQKQPKGPKGPKPPGT